MAKAKAPTPRSAPGDPAAEPGLVKKPARKKKRKLWKSKAPDVSERPTGGRKVELRPPKAPEDFSQNWKALQEVRAGPRLFPGAPRTERKQDSGDPESAPRGRVGVEPVNTAFSGEGAAGACEPRAGKQQGLGVEGPRSEALGVVSSW